MREPVDNTTNAPDITVKRLRNGVCHTIITMENKRAMYFTQSAKWAGAVNELVGYLDRVPDSAKPNPALEIGLVGIGKYVRLYCRKGSAKPLKDYPGSGIKPLEVQCDASKIHTCKFIIGIKEKMGG
jgi:hypothetical protein